MNADGLTRIYLRLLGCFPHRYRSEYAEELAYTFRMAVEDAQVNGSRALWMLAWRELRDFPGAVLRAHLRERSKAMKPVPGSHLPGDPIVRWHLAAVFIPFLMLLLFVTLMERPSPALSSYTDLIAGIVILLAVLVLLVAGLGLLRGLPTWSLPALGVVLFMVGYAQLAAAYALSAWPATLPAQIRVQILRGILSQLGFVILGALLLFLFRSFSNRVRQDWSILSFLYFCTTIPFLLFEDPYAGLEPYEAVGFLAMGIGAFLFLIVPRRWQRLLVLSTALILAYGLLAFGIYTIYPDQTFARGGNGRTWEAIQPLLVLPGMLLLLLTPAVLRWIPPIRPLKTTGAQS